MEKCYKKEITIIYENKEKEKIRLFGDKFIENNKNICKIFFNGKEQEIKRFIMNKNYIKYPIIKIKLRIYKNLIDMSYMFSECSYLKYLPDINKLNTTNVIDMSYMFHKCKSLLILPDISKWNTNNIINMNYMFSNCSSLEYLPDISKCNTKNVINIS